MRAKIEKSILSGIVEAPPSKSMAHRLIIAAALSEGECKIENVSMSEDISATSECMKKLGKEITFDNGTLYIKNAETKYDDRVLFVNESGMGESPRMRSCTSFALLLKSSAQSLFSIFAA